MEAAWLTAHVATWPLGLVTGHPPLAELGAGPAAAGDSDQRLPKQRLALPSSARRIACAERIAGMRLARRTGEGEPELAATEVGDAVHGLLERVDLATPWVPDDFEGLVRTRYLVRALRRARG